jgi:hypothetical protein
MKNSWMERRSAKRDFMGTPGFIFPILTVSEGDYILNFSEVVLKGLRPEKKF